jgi:diguanylate cyclase (GGDEF)-like protein
VIDTRVPLGLTTATAVTAGCAGIGFLAMLPVEPSPLLAAFLMTSVAGSLSGVLLWGSNRAAKGTSQAVTRRPAPQVPVLHNPATGLALPVLAELTLASEFAAAQRGRQVSLILMRVEQVSRYTSRHGRPMAERLLRTAGRLVASQTRGMNLSAHYRGDDATFLLVLSDTPMQGACDYGKRLRRELMTLPGFPEGVVVSAGIVAYDHDQSSPDELLSRAERALAKASAAGGKIIVYGRSPTAAES